MADYTQASVLYFTESTNPDLQHYEIDVLQDGAPLGAPQIISSDDATDGLDDNAGEIELYLGSLTAIPDESVGNFSIHVYAVDSIGRSNLPLNVFNVAIDFTSPPVMPDDTSVSVNENTTLVGGFVASVGSGVITYTLSGADAAYFTIDESTAEVNFINAPDFESDQLTYNIEVVATNNKGTDSQLIQVDITDAIEVMPSLGADVSVDVQENTTLVGIFNSTVGDQPITYALSGTDAALFTIDESTAEVNFINAPDFESDSLVYDITITATNVGGEDTRNITVNVSDMPEAPPVMPANASLDVAENGTFVGAFAVLSGDQPVTYTLSGTDAAYFTIDGSTAEVNFIDAPDYENDQLTYTITITATNDFGSDSQDLALNVTDAIEGANDLINFGLIGSYTLPTINGSHTEFEIILKWDDFNNQDVLARIDEGGGNLRFSSDEEGNNQLPCSVIEFNKAEQRACVILKLPVAETGSLFYLWGKNAGAAQQAAGDLYGSRSVWSNAYAAIFPTNDTNIINEVTGDAVTATATDTGDSVFGGSVTVDGGFEIDNLPSYDQKINGFTLDFWIKVATGGLIRSTSAKYIQTGANSVNVDTSAYNISTQRVSWLYPDELTSRVGDYVKVTLIYSAGNLKVLHDGVVVDSRGSSSSSLYADPTEILTDTTVSLLDLENQNDHELSKIVYYKSDLSEERVLTEFENQNAPSNWGVLEYIDSPDIDSVTPAQFTLTDLTGQNRSVQIESNVITVSGIDAGEQIPVTITNGEYAVSTDGGTSFGAWTTAQTNVELNYQIKVRHLSSANYSTTVNTVLDVGGVVDTFTSTTEALVDASPTISLLGGDVVEVTISQGWSETGFSATDAEDGDLTADVVVTGSVDGTTAGTYYKYYNVSDSAGNTAEQVVRTVVVVDDTPVVPDTPEAPEEVTDPIPVEAPKPISANDGMPLVKVTITLN